MKAATVNAILRGELPIEPSAANRTASYTVGQLNLRAEDPVLFRNLAGPGFYTGRTRSSPRYSGGIWTVALHDQSRLMALRDVWPSDLPAQAHAIVPHDYQI